MNSVPIGELVESGRQCNPSELGRDDFMYIDISSVDRETKRIIGAQRIRSADAPSRARKQVRACDVILSTVRPNLNAVAFVPRELDCEIASTGFAVLRAKASALDPSYLFYFLQTEALVSDLTRIANGASYPAVSDDDVLNTTIPLPDLSEQKRIAAILERAGRLRRLRRYGLEMAETLLSAAFLELFGARFHEGPFLPLIDLVKITGGGTPSRERPEYFRGRIPWLTSKDMRGDYICDTEEHITQEAIKNSCTNLVPADSIVLVVKSKVLMHRLPVAIAKVAICHGQDIKSIQCSEELHPEFARFVLKYYEPRLLQIARGANTEGLTLPMLEELPVPKVDLVDQEKFAALVARVERMRSVHRESLRQAEHLFQTLLHRAFTNGL